MAGFFAGALVGGLLGAGLASLCAPRTGEETRRKLLEWRDANRINETPRTLPGEIVDFCGDLVAAAIERVDLAVEVARRATQEARDSLADEWEARKRGDSTSQAS
jgi:gas vesicle protein